VTNNIKLKSHKNDKHNYCYSLDVYDESKDVLFILQCCQNLYCIALNSGMTDEELTGKDLEESSHSQIDMLPGSCLKGLKTSFDRMVCVLDRM
jgi:hypothetical protein